MHLCTFLKYMECICATLQGHGMDLCTISKYMECICATLQGHGMDLCTVSKYMGWIFAPSLSLRVISMYTLQGHGVDPCVLSECGQRDKALSATGQNENKLLPRLLSLKVELVQWTHIQT
jgi:hypothetical protein